MVVEHFIVFHVASTGDSLKTLVTSTLALTNLSLNCCM